LAEFRRHQCTTHHSYKRPLPSHTSSRNFGTHRIWPILCALSSMHRQSFPLIHQYWLQINFITVYVDIKCNDGQVSRMKISRYYFSPVFHKSVGICRTFIFEASVLLME
jgi:hypothetical protein